MASLRQLGKVDVDQGTLFGCKNNRRSGDLASSVGAGMTLCRVAKRNRAPNSQQRAAERLHDTLSNPPIPPGQFLHLVAAMFPT